MNKKSAVNGTKTLRLCFQGTTITKIMTQSGADSCKTLFEDTFIMEMFLEPFGVHLMHNYKQENSSIEYKQKQYIHY